MMLWSLIYSTPSYLSVHSSACNNRKQI
ncbi:unnamed protein product [Acanthoscelides obtectus]|uniref:Uncharacterized protein n=1 Tax=Acanthoscelides obtectus TaxID=200917 RepID=A0A9P0L0L5_ACAOB|nr:unnamed protein product [Acanthoscelides obtectus]CAK1624739.1 hypothetical protein AOBTE_LOCUS2735 [Acanthoscelides obtectus]